VAENGQHGELARARAVEARCAGVELQNASAGVFRFLDNRGNMRRLGQKVIEGAEHHDAISPRRRSTRRAPIEPGSQARKPKSANGGGTVIVSSTVSVCHCSKRSRAGKKNRFAPVNGNGASHAKGASRLARRQVIGFNPQLINLGGEGGDMSVLTDRMIRDARLDVNLYEEVEADKNTIGQAAPSGTRRNNRTATRTERRAAASRSSS
jgi:hypothetical protein